VSTTVSAAPFVIDFSAAFDRYIESIQKVWVHDRSTTAGGSEVFNCLRQLWFEKRGTEFGYAPDEDYSQAWGAMHRGNIIEDHFVVPVLRQELPKIGIGLEFAGKEQHTLVKDRNSATPDGLLTDVPNGPVLIKYRDKEILIYVTDGCIGLEIKSIDPRATLEEEKAKHHGQAQVGMGLIRETTEWRPKHWVILYIDASFIDNITPFVVEFDPGIYAAAKRRAAQVWSIDDPMKIVPEGKFDKGCDFCRWRGACTDAILSAYATTTEKYDAFDVADFDPVVQEFLATKQEAEEASERYEQAKQKIKDRLLERKINKVKSDAWSISWSTVKGRTYLDTAALEAAGVNLALYQKQGQGHEQLRVTTKKTP
jgi:hypothetical protein